MWKEWLVAPAGAYGFIALSFLVVYGAIILGTRLAGLRSFSKMSAPDFAMTVAVGSLFASSIATSSPPLLQGLFAIACLFAGQWFVAFLRRRSPAVANALDNSPLLLMEGDQFIEANMERANVTRADIRAKLREANVLELSKVRAVVFETTGDVSVLHSSDPEISIDEELLADVAR